MMKLLFVPGAPGGPELLILSLILLMAIVPIVIIGVLVLVFRRDGSTREGPTADPEQGRMGDGADRAALERRVERLEKRVDALEADRER